VTSSFLWVAVDFGVAVAWLVDREAARQAALHHLARHRLLNRLDRWLHRLGAASPEWMANRAQTIHRWTGTNAVRPDGAEQHRFTGP
jgi:hypothetical protein